MNKPCELITFNNSFGFAQAPSCLHAHQLLSHSVYVKLESQLYLFTSLDKLLLWNAFSKSCLREGKIAHHIVYLRVQLRFQQDVVQGVGVQHASVARNLTESSLDVVGDRLCL
uniref:Uncharacterized protein n=1 Tax=Physcomitrium patens TaxID=3218 RepID=A0A2K1IQE8_PHYPA|nr:hypothetical protein PHYPA_025625 [Physcomitrium patens]